MKQRLALAYVLMEDPELLLLDEPFSGIDKESVVVFRNLLLSLKKNGKTILLTSHYQEDINLLCDRVFEMDNGTLVEVQE
jgi:ABC-2 type transport system ATP-binding protein